MSGPPCIIRIEALCSYLDIQYNTKYHRSILLSVQQEQDIRDERSADLA